MGSTKSTTAISQSESKKGISRDRFRVEPKFSASSETLDRYAREMLEDFNLNLTWLPDHIETQIYKFVIEKIVNRYFDCISGLEGASVAGHHIELELKRNSCMTSQNSLSVKNLNVIVDRLLRNKSIEISWLPAHLQKDLYFHVVYLLLKVMSLFVGTSECDIIGHRIGVSIDHDHRNPLRRNSEKSNIDAGSLHRHAESIFATGKTSSYLPAHIEKTLLITIDVIVLNIIEEMFFDFRLNLIGDQVCFYLQSGEPQQRHQSTEIEEEILGKLSKTKLQEYESELRSIENRLCLVNRQLAVCDGEISMRSRS